MTYLSKYICFVSALLLQACGGGASSPVVTPPVAIDPVLDFSMIQAEIDRHSVSNMAIMIGDETGALFTYEKGDFSVDDIINVASATKLITGLGVWSLVENGQLSETSRPQDFIDFWTNDPSDQRSEITLSQLLSFTSGFNTPPTGGGCQGSGDFTLFGCVNESYEGGVDTIPGQAFSYGPEHMQIASLMAREVTGIDLKTTIRNNVLDPSNTGADIFFLEEFGDNPRYSGGMNSSTTAYSKVLVALLAGHLVQDLDRFLIDRTAGADVAFTLPAIENTGVDWHYGFGFWKECDLVPYASSCDESPIISSPGAFGFLPWIDFENGYWAILAMKEPIGFGRSPSTASGELEQILQPMIVDILDN